MSSMISAQGVVFATAMAVSGTVILLALRLQKPLPPSPPPVLRSCIPSGGFYSASSPVSLCRHIHKIYGKKRERAKKKKKKVHFAEDVVESCRDGEEFRNSFKSKLESKVQKNYSNEETKIRGMPANRVALYNGILRDRVAQRLAYSC
ncbi:hypothetical protein RJT34_32537 [Clitoria ternatea]|uniref:Uncharacterized protein n=1 Tax=Clitoria ternatea TaxID=43366 RepID=A0AAN9I4P2_CLITE